MSTDDPIQAARGDPRRRLQERYDRLWSSTLGRMRSGDVEPDPILAAGLPDRRRGLTVIARPSLNVRRRVAAFLRRLHGLDPDQYYYSSSEFHVTVLSLFTATVDYQRFLAHTDQYLSAAHSALRKAAPIRIEFVGVTASPDAIMIQGFFENECLNEIRESLRRQLRIRGLAAGVDRRYRLETAHMTVVRFRARLRDGAQFAAALERARHLPFGSTRLRSVSLVRNDWYMTRRILEVIRRYRLGAGARGAGN